MERNKEIDNAFGTLQQVIKQAVGEAAVSQRAEALADHLLQVKQEAERLFREAEDALHRAAHMQPAPTHTPIVGETLLQDTELKKQLSLNDRFRFAAELFDGDEQAMNHLLQQLAEMSSAQAAEAVLRAKVSRHATPETLEEFATLVRRSFPGAHLY